MRKTFTLIILSLAGLISAQANDYSTMNIRMYDYSNFTVVLGDRSFMNPSSEFILHNIVPGRHWLKVIREPRGHWGRREVVYHGFIDVPPGAQLMTMIDRYHRFSILHTNSHSGPYPDNGYSNSRYGNYRNGNGRNNGNHNGGSWRDNGYRNNTGTQWWSSACGFKHIHRHDFHHLVHEMRSKWFESGKKHVMEHAMHEYHLSSSQIRELLYLLDYENSRLQMAKKGYEHTCDKANYFIVFDVFYFDSSVRALSKFMARHPY